MNQTSYFPLSVSQLGIYYECAKDKSLTTYNRPFVVKMSLDTDTIRLCTAIRTVFKAHPTLNTEIEIINEEPSQSYDAGKPVEIGELVVSESDIDELKRNYARPFEIIGSRLYRIDIYRTEKNVYLFYDIHHIIIDGTSLSVFVSDIASAYDGADLEEETYTVGQYALDEALHAGDEKYRQNESFFASVMDGAEMVSLASPKNESGIGYMRRHSVTMPLKCVDDFCATNRVTPNIFFASGLGICLWRFAREEKIGFCTVHNGRLDTRIVRNTGMFVKTLPVIIDVKPEMKIADFMVSVRQYLKVLWTKQNYPFAEIVKNFGANMEIAYTFQNKMAEHFTIGGIRVEIERLYRGLCADKLEIYIIAQDNDYEIRFEYNDALFDDDYIRSFASSMQAVLRQMLVSAESKCREIQLLSADDEEYILGFSHGKRLLVDNSKTVISLFREQVAKTPDKRALIYKEKKFTYAELDEITDRMAFALSACGVRPETVVGIITERSENIVILPLAVMKAGGAYIPLDPTMPPERLLFMLNDAGVNVVISDGDMAERIIPSYKGRVFCSDVLAGMDVPSGTELYPPSPENMFVILYTSGSTGTPKGCVLEHRTLVNFCRAHSEENTITSADSTIAYANFAFDAHIMEIYPFLLSGSEVHVISSVDKMNLVWVNDYIERNNITIVFFTTQIGKQFIEDFDNRSLRTMLLGGERLTAVKKPRFVFYNLYGPTECTVYATRYKVEKDYDGNVIGSPLYNYNIYVTDNMMKLLPIGISGELCIGGGVGRGYLNRKELTAAKFVDFCGERVYRTGDLVRWNSNGEIEFLGRMDGQVKLRGLRIELGEIENRMMMFPDITAAVTDVKDIAGVQHLCGYFTAKSRIEIASLRDFMSETLTEFMIPTGIMQLDNFPLTSNGKINRRVLPAPEVTQDEIVLPATNTEREILEIVAELIKNHDFGVTTNLFSIGITSILAIKLSTLISTRLSLDIPTKTILKLKTIRTFAVEGKESIRGISKTYEKQRLNPLTETQKGIYYDWAKVPEALQYNIPMILRLPSITDVKRLRRAVMDVIDAHPYIKSGMQMSDDEPKLLRRDDDNPEVLLYDAKDGDIERLEKEFVRPFDLFSDSLYRVEIYKTPEAVYLLSDFHHIIYDGTSMGIFYSDLSRAYNGEQLLKESYTAFDVAYYEDEQSREEPYLKAAGYFAKKLQGVTMTQLPAAASPTGGDKAQSVICHIPQGEILNFCMDAGVTENSFFLAVLCQILNRYTRDEQIAVTTASGGRSTPELSSVIGMFVKTLPVVVDILPENIGTFVKRVQNEIFSVIEHEIYPFTEMVGKFGISPQINYVYEGGIGGAVELEGMTVSPELLKIDTAKFPFAIFVTPENGGYELRIEFNCGIYGKYEAECFAGCFKSAASFMSVNPDAECAKISLLLKTDYEHIMELCKTEIKPYDDSITIIDIFRRQAVATPDKTAVVYKNTKLSYREVDELSDKIASLLTSLGVAQEQAVGIMIERSEYMIVYPIAVMKAGAAYMPLDPTMPSERLSFMVGDAGVKIILSEGILIDEILPNFEGKVIKKEDIASLCCDIKSHLQKSPLPSNMFVILYTSGSTGVPKGCVLEHHNLLNFCNWYNGMVEITSADKSLAYANFAFDAHMLDIYPILIAGGEVHVISSTDKLDLVLVNDYMEKNGITVTFFTTQIGKQFVEDFDNRSLRFLSLGGERLTAVKKPRYRFVNGYGPTECTIFSTIYDIKSFYNSNNIGRAIGGYEIFVLDQNLLLLPPGVPGELCIGGKGVGRGYLNRPDVSAAKFIMWNGRTVYRTADQVRMNHKGEIEYIGRMDGQIKLRGLRIELGEVECRMAAFPGISVAVADVKEIAGVQHLCGYFTAKETVDIEKLRSFMGETLTEFMIPTGIMQLTELPVNQNGKVNRKVLPLPIVKAEEVVLPENEKEEHILKLAKELLKTDDFGVTTNLFTIGMTSILAIKLSTLLHNKLLLNLPTKDILKLKTVRLFAGAAVTVGIQDEKHYEVRPYYPLSESQKGIYYDWEKNREALQYNVPYALKLGRRIDVGQLKDAIILVIEAHRYIKTTLALKGDEVVQLRREDAPVSVLLFETEEHNMNSVFKKFVRPFNLFGDNLYRIEIHKTENDVYLLTDIHHIIYDGTSMGIWTRDIKSAYEGCVLQPEQFSAYEEALRQEEEINSDAYTEAGRYFENLLSGVSMTQFPPSATVGWSEKSGKLITHIPGESVKSFSKNDGITESNIFLSSLCQVLNRYVRDEEIVLSTVSSGRSQTRLADTIGMFVRTLPVVAHIKPQKISEFMQQMQEQVFSTIEREIYPFTSMVEKYGIIPQISYVYEGGIDGRLTIGGEEVYPQALGLDTVKFPLAVVVSPENNGSYRILIEYDRGIYSEKEIGRLAESYIAATNYMVAHKDESVTKITLIKEDEWKNVLKLSEGAKLKYDKNLLLIDRFRRHVAKNPEMTAFVDAESEITYAEADRRSSALAVRLKELGVKKNSFVAIMMPRKKEYLIALLATHKAGGAFVPFDSEYPTDRLLYMLEDSEAKVLITERMLYEEKRKDGDFLVNNILFIDEFIYDIQGEYDIPSPSPESLAYMIYTSGSTGKPKGVMISQKAILAFAAWSLRMCEMKPGENIALHTSFSFDASMSDIATTLYVGSTLHIISSAMRHNMVSLTDYIKANNIVGGSFPTQFGMEMLNQFDTGMRYVVLGGEKLKPMRKQKTTIINGYGPTEFTVSSSEYKVDQNIIYDNIPIGKPAPNTWQYIMDVNSQLLPVGIHGELCLSGEQIARGYWKLEELTEARFTENPYSDSPENAKLYHTGDLVKWNDNGELECLGRIDTQVKLRGFRIELGEIESLILKYKDITTAVAEIKDISGTPHLCVYYTANKEIDVDKLREHLTLSLTEYMVPDAYMQMDSLPLTPNGKVNRKALPCPELTRTTEYVAPENGLENDICNIYSEILAIDRIGIDDNFFEIGGTSLLAIKTIIRIINLGYKIEYGDLFRLKTPRCVAAFLVGDAITTVKDETQDEDLSMYDYSAIERVLGANRYSDTMDYERIPYGSVLLSGATGYLGLHILRELIDSEAKKIYCMVRKRKDMSIGETLQTLLMYYFSDTFDEQIGKRIIPVSADITDMQLLEELRGHGIKTVFNCAAIVKHYAAGNELNKVNIDGVANLVDFCKKESARLIQVSTISISGSCSQERARTLMFDETSLYLGQHITNKYVLSKFKAERLVLQSVSEGLDAKIMRVGNLMGRNSDGEFQINFSSNAFVNLLKAYKVMKMYPTARLTAPAEISPIDCVAHSIVSLSRLPKEITVLHPYNNYTIDMASIIYGMKEYGFPIEFVSEDFFNKKLKELMTDEKENDRISGLLHYGSRKGEYPIVFGNSFTTTMLYKDGIRWPLVSDDYSVKFI